jgi:hypothetical protein
MEQLPEPVSRTGKVQPELTREGPRVDPTEQDAQIGTHHIGDCLIHEAERTCRARREPGPPIDDAGRPGPHEAMDRRAILCFDRALADVGLDRDARLRQVRRDYFSWAATTTMARYHDSVA